MINHLYRIAHQGKAQLSLVLLSMFVWLMPWQVWAAGTQPSGSGKSGDPYLISTADELIWLRDKVNDGRTNITTGAGTTYYAELTKDIDLGEESWTPIGRSTSPFTGSFDGKGHTISGLNVVSSGATTTYWGLFGYIHTATITDFTLEGAIEITSPKHDYVGTVVGGMKSGSSNSSIISYVNSRVNITIADGYSPNYIGGIVGCVGKMSSSPSSMAAQVEGCTYSGTINSGGALIAIGGIVGGVYYGADSNKGNNHGITVTKSLFKGAITNSAPSSGTYSQNASFGGILGYAVTEGSVTIKNNLSAGTISYSFTDNEMKSCVAAIVGRPYGTNFTTDNVTGNYRMPDSSDKLFGNNMEASLSSGNYVLNVTSANTDYGTVTVTPQPATSTSGIKVQLGAVPADLHQFTSWSDNGTQTHLITLPETKSGTYTATFAIVTHTITVASNGNGTADKTDSNRNADGTYIDGKQATIEATPDTGYSFGYWSDGSEQSIKDNPFSFYVTSDQTYTATFAPNQYTIEAKTSDEATGTVTGGGEYDYFSTQLLTATPAVGYHFVSWSDGTTEYTAADDCCTTDAKTGVNTLQVTVPLDGATYTATFAINTYTLNVSSNGNGTVAKTNDNRNDDGTYDHGRMATLEATPDTGYSFDYWQTGNTTSSENPLSVSVTANADYMAYFKTNRYTIATQTSDEATGTVTGGGDYDYLSTQRLTATPAVGYHFVSWSDGTTTYTAADDCCTTDAKTGENTLQVTVPLDGATYTATFEAHIAVIDIAATPVTCMLSGMTASSHCSGCNLILSVSEVILPQGHQFDANHTCTVCQLTVNPANAVRLKGTASGGTAGVNGNENYEYSFDEDTSTKWCLYDTDPYVEFSTEGPVYVTGYSFTTCEDTRQYAERNPKTWKLYGKSSLPDNNWVEIDSKSDDTTLEAENEKEYKFVLSQPTAFQYQDFRIEFTQSGEMQLSEITLYGHNEKSLCPHSKTLTHHTKVVATCTHKGSQEYWSCPDCDKMFTSATASVETMISDPAIPKLPHAVAADDKCSLCGATCVPFRVPTYNTAGVASSGIASWSTAYAAVTEVTEVTPSSTTLSAGWYLVNSEVTIADRITCKGDVHLILTPNGKLNAPKGITVTGITNSLTIYGQPDGAGMLIATGGSKYSSGIGGGLLESGSNITINDGTVIAKGRDCGAGIGGGTNRSGSHITINGGTVTATGGIAAAGIGGGILGSGSDITINGGKVTATGGSNASGIGDGYQGTDSGIAVSTDLVIYNRGNNDAVIANSGSDLATALKDVQTVWIGTPHEHNYIDMESETNLISAATCTKHAIYYRACEFCGKSEEDPEHIFEYGELKPHDYTERVENDKCLYIAGSCTSHATYYYSCAECKAIEKNDKHTFESTTNVHTFVNGVCSKCGNESVAYLVPTYQTENDAASGIASWTTAYIADYSTITSTSTTLSAGWYLVNSEVTIADRITCNGDVHLILTTSGKLNAQKGITVSGKGNALTIYGQPNGGGELIADGVPWSAGIGGGNHESGSYITINGGSVTANGGESGTGIGGGNDGSCSNITINGGSVKAMGGGLIAPGIGGGGKVTSSDIKVSTTLVIYNLSRKNAVITNSGDDLASALMGIRAVWIGPSHEHKYINKVSEIYQITLATCSKRATYYRSCEVCGINEEDPQHTFEDGELRPHEYTNRIEDEDYVHVAGSCTSHAIYFYSCAECGASEKNAAHTFEGTANVHTFVNGVCSKCGNESVAYLVPTYQTENDAASGIASWTTAYIADYSTITSTSNTLYAGWYLVNSEVTIADRITCNGDVHLILTTSGKLNAKKGIAVRGKENSLTIYGQPNGAGELVATGEIGTAGIGGGLEHTVSNITINGGTVTAEGGRLGAGIGAGCNGTVDNITINGGTVNATGGYAATGIGAGYESLFYNITINGGTVKATGGDNELGIGGSYRLINSNIRVNTDLTIYNRSNNDAVIANSGSDIYDAISNVGSVLILLVGDVTSDGAVTLADLTQLIRIYNSNGTLSHPAADMDHNGAITEDDVKALAERIIK